MNWKNGMLFVVGAVLISASLLLTRNDAAQGQGGKGGMGGGARHSVVATDGAHLIVTDNATDQLYFYTIDKDGKIGDELKLRGTVNLREVGQPSIKPIDARSQK
jgi:hypothetical protein